MLFSLPDYLPTDVSTCKSLSKSYLSLQDFRLDTHISPVQKLRQKSESVFLVLEEAEVCWHNKTTQLWLLSGCGLELFELLLYMCKYFYIMYIRYYKNKYVL